MWETYSLGNLPASGTPPDYTIGLPHPTPVDGAVNKGTPTPAPGGGPSATGGGILDTIMALPKEYLYIGGAVLAYFLFFKR
jgi:hypothetical protein